MGESYNFNINALCSSSDGNMIASGGLDGDISIWNVHTRELMITIRGNYEYSYCGYEYHRITNTIIFSPDSKKIITINLDKNIIIREIDNSDNTTIINSEKNKIIKCMLFSEL